MIHTSSIEATGASGTGCFGYSQGCSIVDSGITSTIIAASSIQDSSAGQLKKSMLAAILAAQIKVEKNYNSCHWTPCCYPENCIKVIRTIGSIVGAIAASSNYYQCHGLRYFDSLGLLSKRDFSTDFGRQPTQFSEKPMFLQRLPCCYLVKLLNHLPRTYYLFHQN